MHTWSLLYLLIFLIFSDDYIQDGAEKFSLTYFIKYDQTYLILVSLPWLGLEFSNIPLEMVNM